MERTTETRTPRAFYPESAIGVPLPMKTPGWDMGTERRIDDGETLARALGWLSIGLGAAEALAPDRISRFLGIDGHEELVRFYGVRGIASGLGILSERQPTPWVWSRVAGGFLDIATLATGLSGDNPRRGRAAGALALVAGITALDVLCATQLGSRPS